MRAEKQKQRKDGKMARGREKRRKDKIRGKRKRTVVGEVGGKEKDKDKNNRSYNATRIKLSGR